MSIAQAAFKYFGYSFIGMSGKKGLFFREGLYLQHIFTIRCPVNIPDIIDSLLGKLSVQPLLVFSHHIQNIGINLAIDNHRIANAAFSPIQNSQLAVLLQNSPLTSLMS